MAGLDEGGFDIEDVDFVEHRLDEAFDGVFGGAVGAKAGDAEGTGRGGEDEVAAVGLGAKDGEGELDDVQGAEKVCVELVAEVEVVLIFAGPNDT